MTRLSSRRRVILLLMLTPVLASVACVTLLGGPSADPQNSDVISAQGDLVFGPGSFNFLDPAAGLSDLSGYKATMSLSFNGTEGGQASQWSKTYGMLVVTD